MGSRSKIMRTSEFSGRPAKGSTSSDLMAEFGTMTVSLKTAFEEKDAIIAAKDKASVEKEELSKTAPQDLSKERKNHASTLRTLHSERHTLASVSTELADAKVAAMEVRAKKRIEDLQTPLKGKTEDLARSQDFANADKQVHLQQLNALQRRFDALAIAKDMLEMEKGSLQAENKARAQEAEMMISSRDREIEQLKEKGESYC